MNINFLKIGPLLLALLLCVSSRTTAQNIPVVQTLTGGATINCPQDNILTLQSSQTGFNYYLRKDNDKTLVGA